MNDKSSIDKIFDENNYDNIILYNENGEETEFQQIALVPLHEKIYVMLSPVTKIVGVNDDEALVFVLEEIDDEETLVLEHDEKIINEVFEVYYQLLRDNGIDVDSKS